MRLMANLWELSYYKDHMICDSFMVMKTCLIACVPNIYEHIMNTIL